jgi:hypothetical protein
MRSSNSFLYLNLPQVQNTDHVSTRRFLMFEALLSQLETDLRATLSTCITGLVATARASLEQAHADLATERAKALAEVDVKRAELGREVSAMQMHKEVQEGHVELNIGGYRFETSVQTLRRVPHTFFDAYFSGRYAQDVCNDGSIFVDRDGEHFGHILEYMRSGVVPAAEADTRPSVSLLRALRREFGFYCIELSVESPKKETVFVMGGLEGIPQSSMERYEATSRLWSKTASMGAARDMFGACAVAGEIFVTGGLIGEQPSSSVERYSPFSDTWSNAVPLPETHTQHGTVAVGSVMYVLGGIMGENDDATASVLKFETTRGIWSLTSPMPEPRYDHATCAAGECIYILGGCNDQDDPQYSVFKFDTRADTWCTLAPMPLYSAGGHSASICQELIYVVGYSSSTKRVLRFNPSMGTWSTVAPTLKNHWRGTTFVLEGCLYAAGGVSNMASVERYDEASDTWSAVANMLHGRRFFDAVVITNPSEDVNLFDSLISESLH